MTTIIGDTAYNDIGPFTVQCEHWGYINAHYRCWLTSDPEKKVCFEGNAREIGEFFESVCYRPQPVGKS